MRIGIVLLLILVMLGASIGPYLVSFHSHPTEYPTIMEAQTQVTNAESLPYLQSLVQKPHQPYSVKDITQEVHNILLSTRQDATRIISKLFEFIKTYRKWWIEYKAKRRERKRYALYGIEG
jgi:hypothetical protein